jgi:serine protease Do
MNDVSQARVIIRHVSGSKTNQVEQIPLKDLHEITIGRDPTSTIAFDQRRDDVVSRRHSLIRVEGTESNPIFRISDLGSSNGTFLNGQPVTGEVELSPEDVVELGKGGPKFSFDVQPRPANWAARTRVLDALDTTVTRAIATVAADPGATREAVAFEGAKELGGAAAPVKAGVGKDTVLRMLNQQRKSTSRAWMGSLAAVIAALCVVGYGFYRHYAGVETHMTEALQQSQQAAKQAELQAAEDAKKAVNDTLGMRATDINRKYGDSTVYIRVQWRLYDEQTGKPLFQKTVGIKDARICAPQKSCDVPAFIDMGSSLGIVRWLTLEDEDKTNIPITEGATGSGFVVSENGFVLTNKHVAAGWMVPFENIGQDVSEYGMVYPFGYDANKRNKIKPVALSLKDDRLAKLQDWFPEDGAYVFDPIRPNLIGGGTQIAGDIMGRARVFIGRDDSLEVRFPGNRMSLQASFVRASTDSDAALIKIDAPQTLRAVQLATDDKVNVGDRVFVLGYPAVSEKTVIMTTSSEAGVRQERAEFIPEPTLTEGIISHLGVEDHERGGAKVVSSLGDAFQMTINSTGAGNSGGPVFNDKGHVVGLFTYSRHEQEGTMVTYAVPVKYGRDLLQPQRANAD